MKERIQKILAQAGYGSRREIERWISAGDIQVNGKLATLGQQISVTDRVLLRGQPLHLNSRLKAKPKVLIYNKRSGEVCTRHDPEDRPTVFEQLPRIKQGRWVMVGRLDVNTDGLLLFTTDGELANRLMHPSSEIEREYAVRVLGEVDEASLARLKQGVELEDGPAHFAQIKEAGGEGANHWYHVIIAEGRNREVRRLWESQGFTVSRLIRIRYGTISLPRYLRSGHYEELDIPKLRKLYESVGLSYEEDNEVAPKMSTGRPQSRTERRAQVRTNRSKDGDTNTSHPPRQRSPRQRPSTSSKKR